MIEAVVENIDIKHRVFAEVEKHRKAGSVVATNTSGIPIESIAEHFSDDFKQHFHAYRSTLETAGCVERIEKGETGGATPEPQLTLRLF